MTPDADMPMIWMVRFFAAALLVAVLGVTVLILREGWKGRDRIPLFAGTILALFSVAILFLNIAAWRLP